MWAPKFGLIQSHKFRLTSKILTHFVLDEVALLWAVSKINPRITSSTVFKNIIYCTYVTFMVKDIPSSATDSAMLSIINSGKVGPIQSVCISKQPQLFRHSSDYSQQSVDPSPWISKTLNLILTVKFPAHFFWTLVWSIDLSRIAVICIHLFLMWFLSAQRSHLTPSHYRYELERPHHRLTIPGWLELSTSDYHPETRACTFLANQSNYHNFLKYHEPNVILILIFRPIQNWRD